MARKKKASSPSKSSTDQLGLFDKPAKKPAAKKKRIAEGEVRTYKTKAGHTYELRRVK